MERKWDTLLRTALIYAACIVLLTLSCAERHSGQAENNPFDNIQYRQQLAEVIEVLYKQWRVQRCLSAVVKQASDTNTCFDCHDKIERR